MAVGASETVGVGADLPEQAWPEVLRRTRLPEGTRFTNVGARCTPPTPGGRRGAGVPGLSLETPGAPPAADRRPAPSPEDAPVLEAVGWEATSTEQVLVRTGLTPSRLAVALTHLDAGGWVRKLGGWWERAAP